MKDTVTKGWKSRSCALLTGVLGLMELVAGSKYSDAPNPLWRSSQELPVPAGVRCFTETLIW